MSAPDPTLLWNELASQARLRLGVEQHQQLWRYIDLLLQANQRMNLTRIASRDEAALLHIADSLTLLPHLPDHPHRVADVGSGGGVPGIPLAVARPDVQVTLIESTRKKAEFLAQTVGEMKLQNVAIEPLRVEQVARSESREAFDAVVVRAVATLDWLAEWCLPLLKVGGSMLAMKGPKVRDELPQARRAIKLLGGGEARVFSVDLPGTDEHLIVKVPKISRSDPRFPRDPTIAKAKPLR